MISPLYFFYAILGGAIQVSSLYLMRAKGIAFWWVIPLILAHQYFFTTGYAKAPNFVIQWFLVAALTGVASFVLGTVVFGDRVSATSVAGILLVAGGLVLMKFG